MIRLAEPLLVDIERSSAAAMGEEKVRFSGIRA